MRATNVEWPNAPSRYVINSRFGSLLAAVHTVAVTLLGSAAILGAIRFSLARIARYLLITAAITLFTIGGLRAAFNTAFAGSFAGEELVYGMRPLLTGRDARLMKPVELGEDEREAAPTESLLQRIAQRGTIRVGVLADRLPFVFMNREGFLVGFDVEMAQLLARDLGVKAQFVQMEAAGPGVPRLFLAGDAIDVAMTGFPVTARRASQILHSEPYLNETLAFLVKDQLRQEFSSWPGIRELGAFPVLIPAVQYFSDVVKARAPALRLTVAASMKQIEQALKSGSADAVVLPAERGSVLSLLHPKYTVVVPEPGIVKIPLAYPVARRDQEFAAFLNTWIELKRRDGTIDALHEHWILGKQATKRQPRWSIMRDILHWVQ